MLNCNLC